jgi:hypothetical protein
MSTTTMKQVTRLQINKYRRKYNDVVRRRLTQAGINYKEQDSGAFGINIMVQDEQFNEANKIVLSISHTNPRY